EPSNCRWASKTTQMRNQKINKRNKSGYKGVFVEKSGSWEASITINYKKIPLGRYKDKNDAIKARKKAEEKYFKHTDRRCVFYMTNKRRIYNECIRSY